MKYVKDSFVVIPNKQLLKGMKSQVQSVFFWICAHADENGECFPSRKTIAESAGVGMRKIDEYIDALEENGLIEKTPRKKEGTEMNMSNVYQILVPEPFEVVAKMPLGSSKNAPRGSSKNAPVTIPIINSIQLTKGVCPSFEEFWKNYPSKVGKKKCLEIWMRSRARFERHLPDIIGFLEKAKQTDRWKKGFVKDPSTFLNQETWEDDLTAYGDARRGITSRTIHIN